MIDYTMLTSEHLDNVTAFEIGSHYAMSDHSPVLWSYMCNKPPPERKNKTKDKPMKWISDRVGPVTESITANLNELGEIVDGRGDCSEVTRLFTNKIYDLIKPILQPAEDEQNQHGNRQDLPYAVEDRFESFRSNRNRPKEPWFCENCGILRDLALHHLKHRRINGESDMNKLRETEASRKYNAHKRQCKRNYRIANTRRVMKLRVDDSRQYWRVLNGGKGGRRPNIPNEDFVSFFTEVNLPADMSPFQTSAETRNFLDNVRDEVSEPIYVEFDLDFTIEEIKKAVNSSRNNKAAGSDCLVYEVFKKVDIL